MRLSRIIGALVGALALAALPAAAAEAAPYPPPAPVLSLSLGTITLGDEVTLVGRQYDVNEGVHVTFTFRPLAAGVRGAAHRDGSGLTPVVYEMPGPANLAPIDTVADTTGTFSTTIRPDQTGRATIVATGRASGRSASVTLTVLPAGSQLPRTGSNLAQQTMIGAALIAAGTLLVLMTVFWRRRGASRGQHAPSAETVHPQAARR
jgi:hypothetical protein